MENFDFAILNFMKFVTMFFVYGLTFAGFLCLINSVKNKKWLLFLGVLSILLAIFGYCATSINPDAQVAEHTADFYYTLVIGLGLSLMSGIFCFVAYIRTPNKQTEEETNDNEEI